MNNPSEIDLRGLHCGCLFMNQPNIACTSTLLKHPEITAQYACLCDADERNIQRSKSSGELK